MVRAHLVPFGAPVALLLSTWSCGAATGTGLEATGDAVVDAGQDGISEPRDGSYDDGQRADRVDHGDGIGPGTDASVDDSQGGDGPGEHDARSRDASSHHDGATHEDATRPPDDGALPDGMSRDAGAGITTVAVGQSPQALALDGTYVYWENATGTVVDCPLAGCPTLSSPSVLVTSAVPPDNLEELAVGASTAYFVGASENLDYCAGSGCSDSPAVFWPASEGDDGPYPTMIADSTNLYYTDAFGNIWLEPLGGGAATSMLELLDGFSTLALSPTELYLAQGSGSFLTILATPVCSMLTCNEIKRTVCTSSTLFSGDIPAMVVTDDYVYFTTSADPSSIYECPSDGSGAPSVYVTDVAPYGLATDGTRLFWTSYVSSGTVASCAASATCASAKTIASGQDEPLAIAVNGTAVFWTTSTAVYEAPK
jgi:hypothetical protein